MSSGIQRQPQLFDRPQRQFDFKLRVGMQKVCGAYPQCEEVTETR